MKNKGQLGHPPTIPPIPGIEPQWFIIRLENGAAKICFKPLDKQKMSNYFFMAPAQNTGFQ